VLGRLRESGRLAVPVVVTFTDFSVHPLWIAPGVDLYVAPHAVTAAQAVGFEASRVAVARPLVSARFQQWSAARRARATERYGLAGADKPPALLLGGSWGVGEIEETARDLAASGMVTPVVVCGRNEVLRGRLRAEGFPHVFGWVGDMPSLMAACDVMVQNAGASSTLEAFATGLPVATYRSLAGHGRTNAAVLDEAGLAMWVRSSAELPGALRELTSGVRGRRQRNAGLAMIGDGAEPDALIMELVLSTTAETVAV
jgi:UDP-N-acetylglucosamine:LPS N-acetylglucosamine transferase